MNAPVKPKSNPDCPVCGSDLYDALHAASNREYGIEQGQYNVRCYKCNQQFSVDVLHYYIVRPL